MSKEAMKLALEALDGIYRYGLDTLSGRSDGPDDRDWQRAGVNEMTKRARFGITALKALAEQPAQQQEPVDLEAVYETIIRWDIGGGKRSRRELARRIVALYTSPPASKPWVGLTDDEIAKMPAWIYSPDQDGMTVEEGLETFARAIETKLKEKNT